MGDGCFRLRIANRKSRGSEGPAVSGWLFGTMAKSKKRKTVAVAAPETATPTGQHHHCRGCDESFPSKVELTQHPCSPATAKPHECSVCHRRFKVKQVLILHSRVHSGDRPHACDTCDKSYRFAHGLRNHRLTHTGDRAFACSLCPKRFTQRTFLTIHLRSHTDERPYDCAKCGKAFHQRSHLRYHLLTHSQRRGYTCPVCGTRLRYKQSLQLHLRIHGADKPFSCETCGKSFHEKPKLRIHQRTHTGEKPYTCATCGRGFAQKGNRDKHTLRYHARDQERKFPCLQCPKAFIWKKCLDMHLTWHRLQEKRLKQKGSRKRKSRIPPEGPIVPPPPERPASECLPGSSAGDEVEAGDKALPEQGRVLEEVKVEFKPDAQAGSELKVLTSWQNGEWVVVPGAECDAAGGEDGSGDGGAEEEDDEEEEEDEEQSGEVDGGSLKENMRKLLPHLLDDEVLQEIGWPDVGVEEMVTQVLRWCDQKPVASARHEEEDVFECNVQLLLNIVLEEKFTEAGDLRGKSSNDILRELLKQSAIA